MARSQLFRNPSEDEEPITVRAMPFGRPLILIADDDPAMRNVVAETLQTDGYLVRIASTGRALLEAIASIEAGHLAMDGVDLVVLDNRMPGMTGLDALRTLRGAERSVPAILMTAYPSANVESEAARLGARVLPKPFGRAELHRTVLASLLGRQVSPW